MKIIIALILTVTIGLGIASVWFEPYMSVESTERTGITLTPGSTLHLEVPQFYTEDGKKRVCELHIPEQYRKDEPVPLLVWFSPGKGSSSLGSVPDIVDKSKFLVLALPYPDNKLPRLAVKAGKIDTFWAFEAPMLEYVRDLVPNISERVRIAGGFSSGAHLVGSGLDREWFGFTDFFTTYIMHEGGYSPSMKFQGVKEGDKLLVTYGLQNNSYGKVVVREMNKAGLHPTVKKLPHTGHNMSQEAIDSMREWVEYTVMSDDE